MANDKLLENEKIITNEWDENGGTLEYSLSYLHPDLDVIIQEYYVSSTTYEGKRIFQSSFSLFAPDAQAPGDFSYLPREIKEQLWEIVFAIKVKFFEEYQPDIVEHFVDGTYSLERRYKLYRNKLTPIGYDVELEKTKRTITYQKSKIPTGNGGDFCLN